MRVYTNDLRQWEWNPGQEESGERVTLPFVFVRTQTGEKRLLIGGASGCKMVLAKRQTWGRKEVRHVLNRFEKGQGLVEYALILALIAIVVFAALALLGTKLQNKYGTFTNSFP